MSQIVNGNGNGNGANGLLSQLQKKATNSRSAVSSSGIKESHVTFQTHEGVKLRGALSCVTHHAVVFELCNPSAIPRLSETLDEFKIIFKEQAIYSGRAVVCNAVDAGAQVLCEATLDESHWTDLNFALTQQHGGELIKEFKTFIREWQKLYKMLPEFKLVVGDMQVFFHDLRLWLEQVELGIQSASPADRAKLEHETLEQLEPTVAPIIHNLFERFETVCSRITADLAPAHRSFCHRELHPFLLCAPFMHRIYTKPLGYAGDYEMIDMIMRNSHEGRSLFAKLLHSYTIDQAPAHSVRNRADYFTRKFVEETCRVSNSGRIAKFFSLGCGPAREVQKFLAEHPLSDQTQFQLLDFNEETLADTSNKMDEIRIKYRRKTPVKMVRNSVNQLLKDANKSTRREPSYDFIYCSGLYDYLNDQVCKHLNTYLYDQLLPGGMLVVTNFDPSNPIRNIMEYMYDWFLIHRNSKQLAMLAPDQAAPDDCAVVADATGCNVFLEVRKPLLKT